MKPTRPSQFVTCPSCSAEVRPENMDAHMAWHMVPRTGEVVIP